MKFAETGPLRFVWALNAYARRQHMFTQHSLAEFNDMRCYLSEDERSGFAITEDGELTCLFSGPENGIETLLEAEARGARKLSCFDVQMGRVWESTLVGWYKRQGWREVKRAPFDPEQAPSSWKLKQLDTYRPDVVWMVWP